MGLFNWNTNTSAENSPAKEHFDSAKAHFEQGNYTDALAALSHGFSNDINYKPLYRLSADCLQALGGEQEKELFETVLNDFNNGVAFCQLGDYYYEMEHYHMAISFYEKAMQLKADEDALPHNLAVSYARQFQVQKAHDILAVLTTRDFWSVYFLYKCKILLNQQENVAQALDEMVAFLNGLEHQEGLEVPKEKVAELQEMFQRLQTIEIPQQHIRDWHFIQYGAVILDFFEDQTDYVAGGRYVALWGTNESIKSVVIKLKQLLNKMELSFTTVAALNDRNSTIIGLLIAKVLGIPYQELTQENIPSNALIVAANTADFNLWEQLSVVNDGQLLFALNHNWLTPSVLAPDIVGLMSQAYYFPWDGGGFRFDEITNEMIQTEVDERSAELLANEIALIEVEMDDNNDLYGFYTQRKDWLKGIGSTAGQLRYNFMIESPVTGAYFA